MADSGNRNHSSNLFNSPKTLKRKKLNSSDDMEETPVKLPALPPQDSSIANRRRSYARSRNQPVFWRVNPETGESEMLPAPPPTPMAPLGPSSEERRRRYARSKNTGAVQGLDFETGNVELLPALSPAPAPASSSASIPNSIPLLSPEKRRGGRKRSTRGGRKRSTKKSKRRRGLSKRRA